MGYTMPSGTTRPVTTRLRTRKRLESAGSTITGTGWQTLSDGTRTLTDSFQSRGGTVCVAQLGGAATVTVGGLARIVINGGSFAANTLMQTEPATLAIGTNKIALMGWIDIPSTQNLTTYTITAQGQGSSALSTITPTVNMQLVGIEHPQ